jgi:DNA repair exonuclease SbcCD nuclease subunit
MTVNEHSNFQSIGAVAGKVVDRWAWWQKALANPSDIGKGLKVHESDPQQGYFKTRSRLAYRQYGPWEPVAIFYPEDSDRLVAYRAGKEVRDINALWVWCHSQPITYEAYQKAIDTGGFDDDAPAATVGHNSGDEDPFEALKVELAGEAEQIAEFMRKPVETQADADKVAIWTKRLGDIGKRADAEREREKAPHLKACRDTDDKWRPVVSEAKEWVDKAREHNKPFLLAQKRAEEERQRKAQEEAERIRHEAEEAAQAARAAVAESDEAAQRAQDEADRLAAEARAAEREAEARKINAGRTGARQGIRVDRVGFVTDYAKAAAALVAMKHKDIIAVIDQLANRAAKAQMPFDGMEIREQEKVI